VQLRPIMREEWYIERKGDGRV